MEALFINHSFPPIEVNSPSGIPPHFGAGILSIKSTRWLSWIYAHELQHFTVALFTSKHANRQKMKRHGRVPSKVSMTAAGVKRTLDVVGAFAGLIAGGIPMLGIAAAIRIRMGSPVIFRQVRPGLHGQPFIMLKFRTMSNEYDADGALLSDTERLTALGKFLRSTSLDELPELINVIRGEMSLVGPRPLLTRYTEFFTPREMRRLEVRPGITGMAQMSGRNHLSWDDRLELDIQYVERYSLCLDINLLVTTLAQVVRREGVATDPSSVMKDLDDERASRVQ